MNNKYILRLYHDNDQKQVLNVLVDQYYLNKYLNKGLFLRVFNYLRIYYSTLYVLEDRRNSKILAMGVIRKKIYPRLLGFSWWLYGITVMEEERGKGIGSILMRLLLNQVNDKMRIFIKVDKKNTSAINLYKKFGFQFFCESEKESVMLINIK